MKTNLFTVIDAVKSECASLYMGDLTTGQQSKGKSESVDGVQEMTCPHQSKPVVIPTTGFLFCGDRSHLEFLLR